VKHPVVSNEILKNLDGGFQTN